MTKPIELQKVYLVADVRRNCQLKQLSQHSGHVGLRLFKTLGRAEKFACSIGGGVYSVYVVAGDLVSDNVQWSAKDAARFLGLH